MVTFDELGLPKLTFEAADTETDAENNVAHKVVIVSIRLLIFSFSYRFLLV